MSPTSKQSRCDQAELLPLYALHALPSGEEELLQAHLASCEECRRALEEIRPLIESFSAWPTDILRPADSLWSRVASRIGAKSGNGSVPSEAASWQEPEWAEVAPGISCKVLASDAEHDRVSMLVRLAAGAAYPPHCHAGVEELFLLDGELWIEDRKLRPGDYNRGEPDTSDQRVWSETGCTCLLITSPSDIIA